ncbi:MAG: hypothetical protein RR565_01980 [Erysipelothrix sp.]
MIRDAYQRGIENSRNSNYFGSEYNSNRSKDLTDNKNHITEVVAESIFDEEEVTVENQPITNKNQPKSRWDEIESAILACENSGKKNGDAWIILFYELTLASSNDDKSERNRIIKYIKTISYLDIPYAIRVEVIVPQIKKYANSSVCDDESLRKDLNQIEKVIAIKSQSTIARQFTNEPVLKYCFKNEFKHSSNLLDRFIYYSFKIFYWIIIVIGCMALIGLGS